MEYKISIIKRIKGKIIKDTIKIYTGMGRGDCGYHFNIGETYTVFANYNEYASWGKVKFLSTDICTQTKIYDSKEFKKITLKEKATANSRFAQLLVFSWLKVLFS